jgi:hypothetical protein
MLVVFLCEGNPDKGEGKNPRNVLYYCGFGGWLRKIHDGLYGHE